MSSTAGQNRALELVERRYRQLTGSNRPLHLSDRLEEDLDIDSLLAYVILCALEEVYGSALIERIHAARVHTVKDLVDVLTGPPSVMP